MNEEDVINKLRKIFQDVFLDTSIDVSRKLKADDVDEWDSLTHINLIVAIEKEFNISFSLEEIESQENVGDTIDIILKKL